jgi:hypothetical protein
MAWINEVARLIPLIGGQTRCLKSLKVFEKAKSGDGDSNGVADNRFDN